MRVFGGGFLENKSGQKIPSLSTCDEIKPDTLIKIVRKEKTEKEIW